METRGSVGIALLYLSEFFPGVRVWVWLISSIESVQGPHLLGSSG